MKRDLAYLWISVGFAACGAAVNTAIAVRQGGWK